MLTTAAAELFWHRGYASTSLAQVSARSGVPLGNIYYYFRTKADLAQAVADVFAEETAAMLAEIEAAERDPRRRLAALVSRLARSAKSRVDNGCPIAFCVRDFRREAPQASERAAEAFSLLTGFAARELGRTGLRPLQALSTARSAVSEWQGGMMLAHALKDGSILSESFRRMDRMLAGTQRSE